MIKAPDRAAMRLLIDDACDGPSNMARDEALLAASEETTCASITGRLLVSP